MPTGFSYTPKTDYTTSQGNIAPDLHLNSADYDSAEKAQIKSDTLGDFPNVTVVGDATAIYNCHAFAHAKRHAWFNDINQFLKDDYFQYTPGTLQIGDVCVYTKSGTITHSAVITKLSGNTNISELQSKWGNLCEVKHKPTDVPDTYGTISYYLRKRSGRVKGPATSTMIKSVNNLVKKLYSKNNLEKIRLASTIDAMRNTVTQFPEVAQLQLYGLFSIPELVERLNTTKDDSIIITAVVLEKIADSSVLQPIAKKLSEIDVRGDINFGQIALLHAFETLRVNAMMQSPKELSKRLRDIKKLSSKRG